MRRRRPGGKLPTEAQFEAALRSGQDGLRYPTGNTLPPPAKSANLPDVSAEVYDASWDTMSGYDDGYAFTAPVGSFTHNSYGFADLWGNVWEWTRDWVDPAGYPAGQVSDPSGPATGSFKPLRGSGFYWFGTEGSAVRASYRLTTFAPSVFNNDLGFRCAHDWK